MPTSRYGDRTVAKVCSVLTGGEGGSWRVGIIVCGDVGGRNALVASLVWAVGRLLVEFDVF